MSWLAWVLTGLACTVILFLGTGGIIMNGIPKYRPRFRNTDGESLKWFKQHLFEAKKEVLIVTDEFYPPVYTEFVHVIKEKLARSGENFRVWMIGGPEVCTSNGSNPVLELAKSNTDPRLEIKFLRHRPVQHFRVVDGRHLFLEEPHSFESQIRYVETLERSFFKAWQWRGYFFQLWQTSEVIAPEDVKLK